MYTEWIRQLGVHQVAAVNEGFADMDPALSVEAEMLSRQKGMIEATARGDSNIQKYYNNASIFITGGSGFLGKQLVEKLFRACKIKRVYLLLRPKKGTKIQERLREILKDPVYSSLHKDQPNFADRLVCVEGDVSEIRLGMSDDAWNTVTQEVDTIFHVAATTKFDESLRVATLINVRGTREALTLGKSCKKLRSFIHVSTAYSHATAEKINSTVSEEFYPSPVAPETMLRLVESVDDQRLEGIAPKLTEGWPNTYTFTKAVAEEQVRVMADDLPVCIVRPSIVISSHYEPSPGWLDMSCAYSASGFVIGSGLGLIHVMQTTASTEISLVPVDYVNNAIIAAGWEMGTRQRDDRRETTIYNVVMSQQNKLSWEMLREYCLIIREELAMPFAKWVVYVFCVQNYYLFLLLTMLFHMLPAILMDGVLFLLGKERRFLKLYKKIFKLSVSLAYFLNNTYHLDGNNTESLFSKLSLTDQRIFNFDMKSLNWFDFCKVWCIGIRKYIIKDGLINTELGKRKQFYFKYMNYIALALYGCGIWFVLTNCFYVLCNIFSVLFCN